MFHTPADTEELCRWIDQLPTAGGVRLTAYTAAMMAWNLAAKLTNTTNESTTNAGY
jgi:hypothetical protein